MESLSLEQIGVVAGEPRWKRWLFSGMALVLIGGFAYFLSAFFAPSPGRPGIDENAYLLGGRNILELHTVGWKPANDYLFVGHMWFRTKDQVHELPAWLPGFARRWLSVHTTAGWYYPKYPAGLPLLNAVLIFLGGVRHGRERAFFLSPMCMTLALVGMFFLSRSVIGSFYGLLAMIVLAMTPTALELAELPNSHPPALCFVIWGMFFLVRWLQQGGWWRGVLAGFFLGYAVTIRYSEALLLFPFYPLEQILSGTIITHAHSVMVLIKVVRFLPVGPLGLAALMHIRLKRAATYVQAMLPLIAWAVPVGLLVAFNWFSTGQMTGYDATNESSGFSAATFLSKWDFTVYQLYLFGLFLFLPLGIAGLIILFRGNWRIALVLSMWAIPGSLLYTAYYWGDRVPGVAFLRFFLTVFPPMIIAGLWLLRSAGIGSRAAMERTAGSLVAPLAAGVLVAASAGVALTNSLGDMNRQYRGNLNLHYSEQQVRSHISLTDKQPVIFADNGMFPQFLQYAQFMIDADWYATDVFEPRAGGGFGIMGMFQADRTNQNAPVLLQQDRIDYIDSVRKGKSDADFISDQHQVMDAALAQGRKIYLVTESDDAEYFRRRFISSSYQMKRLERWKEPYDVNFPGSSEQNHLGLAAWSGEPFIHWRPEDLNLYEIGRAPAMQPTTRIP